KRGEELSDEKIPVLKDNIIKLYKGAGFFDASAEVFTVPKRGGQLADIVIKIKEGKRYRIADIRFTGDKIFDDEKLRSILKVVSGAYYDEAEMKSGIDAISKYFIERGYLNVVIEESGFVIERDKEEVSVTLAIEAGPHVEVLFEGAEVITADTIRKELLIWKERAYDTAVLDESADRLTELYQQKGYYLVSISHNVEKPDDRNVRILFKIKEGESVTIRDINFTGNSYFKDEILKDYVDIKEGKYLFDDILREDLRDLSGLYKSNGFLEVRITHQVSFNEDDKTLGVSINVEEGAQTRLSVIRLEGNSSFSRDDIYPRIKSRVGRPFNESQIVDDIYNIQSFYLQKGHIYASVDLKSTFSPDKTDAEVDYIINEGMPVYIGHINITGNSFTRE
ncbi:MAG: POTRA domain-containing protein, partial [Nitrospirota bacterium]